MSANDIIAGLLADAEISSQRRYQRAELRQPHIRNWGIATGARPYRRSAAVGWWALIATVAACAAVIGAALGITPTFF